jgi:hypothetical protein
MVEKLALSVVGQVIEVAGKGVVVWLPDITGKKVRVSMKDKILVLLWS